MTEPRVTEARVNEPREDLAGLTPDELFDRGRQHGMDRTNSGADGPAVTTAASFWVAEGGSRVCPVCRHTFRIGERVWVDHAVAGKPARVVHASRELPCHGETVEGGTDDPELAARFFAAVDASNPLKGGVRLKADSPQVAKLVHRVKCAGCGHSLRPLEVIVFCPCDPEKPRCRLAVHNDRARGVSCFDEWLTGRPLEHCPMSYRKRKP